MAVVNLLLPAFGVAWAENGTVEAIDEAQWRAGWAFIGSTPPSVEQFNKLAQVQDQKSNWLYQQLLAVMTAAGETPSVGDLTSLRDSIATMYGGGRLIGVRVFASPGTVVYNPSAGTKSVLVKAQAGGGGAGGLLATDTVGASLSAGGGGGAYAEGYFTSGFTAVPVTTGAGGTPGPVGSGTGGTGGASSFGALLTVSGGAGSSSTNPSAASSGIVSPPAGGLSITGATIVSRRGDSGGLGFNLASSKTGGTGGAGAFGAGGDGGSNGPGNPAYNAGSGGGGGGQGVSSTAKSGAAGAPGLVIVYEFA